METPNVTITTVNIDFTTPVLGQHTHLDQLKEYFAGMETVLKLIIAIQNNEARATRPGEIL